MLSLLFNTLLAQAFKLPAAQPWTLQRLTDEVINPLTRFINAAGVLFAVMTLVISGIMYFRAGSDTEALKAKTWFKNGLIGALIILGVGVILATISAIVTGEAFQLMPSVRRL